MTVLYTFTAPVVRRCACAGNCALGEPVARGVPFSSGLQDSSGTAAAEEARTRQRVDVQQSNYRPISNLPTVSKVIERLVLDRLRPQLLSSPNFSRLQSAYRRGHSTETDLLHVMDSVYTAADNKKATVLVALDISAAFDTIAHDVLLQRFQTDFRVGGAAIACCTRTSPIGSST